MVNKNSVYIAMSIDGFIADKDGTVKFLDKYMVEGEDYGYGEFSKTVDTVISGNTTFKQLGAKVFKDAYKGMKMFVFTDNPGNPDGDITFTNEDINSFSKKLKGHTWIMGGAMVVNEFLKEDLVDEIMLFIMPEMLGNGVRLFNENEFQREYKLLKTEKYESGVVMLHYSK